MSDTHCPTCDRTFSAPGAVRDHAWDAHRACHYCGEQFDEEEDLYVHWLAVHNDELPRADRKRAESEVGSLTFGDRLAHQGPSAALGSVSRRTLLLGGGVALLGGGGAATVSGVFDGSGDPSNVYQTSEAPTGLSVGEKPPDFTLQTTDGGTVSLRGSDQPTVVFMMAAWCTTCRFESENLQEIEAKYGDSVRIISLDVDPGRDTMADLRRFQSQYGGNWIHAMGTRDVVEQYRIQSLDTTYILNEHGVTVYTDTSVTDASTLDRELSRITSRETGGMSDADFGKVGSVHWHADFSVTINGRRVDFAKQKYMVQSEYVHLEGGDGTTIHKHATGVTLADFFSSIGWELTNECLRTDNGDEYCTGDEGELRIVVNGDEIDNPGEYKIQDGDQIQVSYE
jgi:cytochrome oxidase Cu insertion factor (SCO1/SenC/PrrC family)